MDDEKSDVKIERANLRAVKAMHRAEAAAWEMLEAAGQLAAEKDKGAMRLATVAATIYGVLPEAW